MCGRLNQFASLPELAIAGRLLRIERLNPSEREDAKANVAIVNNICPTDYADVIREADGHLHAVRMRFGLIPAWTKGSSAEVSKKFAHTFNARCETVFDLASYRRPIRHRRCLIPVRGWHEWPDRATPYFIHRSDDAPLLLAGIWDVWQSCDSNDAAGGPLITSMSVITTPPGRYMAKFHDRSPLILEGERALRWLQPDLRTDELQSFFHPYESVHLEAYRVSTTANQARNKSEGVLAPISPPIPQAGDAPVTSSESEIPYLI